MSVYRLDRLLAPHSLAVIGASPRETSVGRHVVANIRAAGFPGAVHVVNPNYAAIEGIDTVKSLDAITGPIDVAVIAVPPAAVPDTVAAAGAKGAAAAIIITAGLGHGAGSLAEAADRAARATGLRLVGPNCIGVLVPPAQLNASFAPRMPQKGDLAVISQSGAVVAGMIEWAAKRAIGFSAVFSVGDQLDVDFGDLLDLFAADGGTRAILLYVESIKDARKFMSAARVAARAKPVIVLKAGRHSAGRQGRRDPHRRARGIGRGLRRRVSPRRTVAGARSRRIVRHHRNARAAQAVSRQSSRDPDQWRRDRRARRRSPDRSRRHARRDFAGHPRKARCGAAADLVEGQSRRHRRRRRCRAIFGRARSAARRPGERRRAGAQRANRARLVDCDGRRRCVRHPRLSRGTIQPKPVLAVWIGADEADGAAFDAAGIPAYETEADAVRGFTELVRYGEVRDALMETPPSLPEYFSPDVAAARAPVETALREGRRWLDPLEAAAVMAAYAIPAVPTMLARDADRSRRGGAAVSQRGHAGGRQNHVAGHRPQVGHRRRAAQSRLG